MFGWVASQRLRSDSTSDAVVTISLRARDAQGVREHLVEAAAYLDSQNGAVGDVLEPLNGGAVDHHVGRRHGEQAHQGVLGARLPCPVRASERAPQVGGAAVVMRVGIVRAPPRAAGELDGIERVGEQRMGIEVEQQNVLLDRGGNDLVHARAIERHAHVGTRLSVA